MPTAASLVARGVFLGLGAAVPIGPVNVEIARRTLRAGFTAGFALGCGAVSVDVAYAILSSLSLHRLLQRSFVLWPLTICGILFLLYLSFLSVRGAMKDLRGDAIADAPAPTSRRGAYLTGVLMTLLNPMTIGFWFLAVPAALGAVATPSAAGLPMVCAGVFAGTIAWVTTFTGVLSWAGRWRKSWWLAAADLTGGAVLFCFALVQVWRVWRAIL
jgi:L-lysine exporter family protein LysE/ArgO